MKKKFLSLVLVAITLVGVLLVSTGCGNNNSQEKQQEVATDNTIKGLVQSGQIKVGDIVKYDSSNTVDGKKHTYTTDSAICGRYWWKNI